MKKSNYIVVYVNHIIFLKMYVCLCCTIATIIRKLVLGAYSVLGEIICMWVNYIILCMLHIYVMVQKGYHDDIIFLLV